MMTTKTPDPGESQNPEQQPLKTSRPVVPNETMATAKMEEDQMPASAKMDDTDSIGNDEANDDSLAMLVSMGALRESTKGANHTMTDVELREARKFRDDLEKQFLSAKADDVSVPDLGGADFVPMPMPHVAAGAAGAPSALPGAYSSAPGESPQRTAAVDKSLLGRHSCRPDLAPDFSRKSVSEEPNSRLVTTDTPEARLSQAIPVNEETEPEAIAKPFEASDLERKRAKQFKRYLCIFGALLLGIVGLVLGLVFRNKKQSSSAVSTTSSPTISVAPSGAPSGAPTTSLDVMVMDLPESTLENLYTFDTPQWNAYAWLSVHPNITQLEEWHKLQLFALATFYYSMDGPDWQEDIRNFWLLPDRSECDWFSSSFGRFREDATYDTGFLYPIAPCNEASEYQAIFLEHLELSDNDRPTIPPEIALMNNLSGVILENSGIHTTLVDFLPAELYDMPITWLHLNSNQLSGPIPTELGRLSLLEQMYLMYNSLSGTVPSELAMLTALKLLTLYDNAMTGTLPAPLPPNLERLELLRNQMTGSIPSEIGLSKLTYLDVKENALTGTLPSELGLLTGYLQLFLHKNLLTGSLPTELGLIGLYNLQLYGNSFVGTFPSEMGLLSGLDRLRLHQNNISGLLPSEMGSMLFLNRLELQNNFLSGSLPEGLWRLPRLQYVDLQDNMFSGSLPSDLGSLSEMQFLNMERNAMTGPLPTALGMQGGLAELRMHSNNFSGSIPTEFGNMTSLAILTLGSNPIAGPVPSELGLMTALVELDLSVTLLSGTIPQEMDALAQMNTSSLSRVNISGTGITGTIPDSLCQLEQLHFDCSTFLCGCDCECA